MREPAMWKTARLTAGWSEANEIHRFRRFDPSAGLCPAAGVLWLPEGFGRGSSCFALAGGEGCAPDAVAGAAVAAWGAPDFAAFAAVRAGASFFFFYFSGFFFSSFST